MARENGCAQSLRDWQVDVLSRAATVSNPVWIRVKGMTELNSAYESEVEDGAGANSAYAEPYVVKRSGTFTLSGRAVTDALTGAVDAGQDELNYFSGVTGCVGDASLRIVDPYGRAKRIDCVVTSAQRKMDESGDTVSWELKMVGAPEELPYLAVLGVDILDGENSVTTLNLTQGQIKSLKVAFTPDTASNQKYSAASSDSTKVRVANVDGLNFDVIAVAPCQNVSVMVKTMNNALVKTVVVGVA